jgi:hypothetical protein
MNTALTNDDHLALALMTIWALHTGRTLPGVPPARLTVQELIDFWGE